MGIPLHLVVFTTSHDFLVLVLPPFLRYLSRNFYWQISLSVM